MKRPLKIAILSRSIQLYSTQRLFETAKRRGHHVHIIDHSKCSLRIESGKPKVYHQGLPVPPLDAIIPRIGASVTFHGTAVIRQFEAIGIFSTLRAQALAASRDKLFCLQVLASAGIPVPKSAFIHANEPLEDLISSLNGPPCIIKLLEGTQGTGVILAESLMAIRSTLDTLKGLQAKVLLQEFISEAKGADLRAFVVDGRVVGAMKRQGKAGEFRSNLHLGGGAKSIVLSTEERQVAVRAAQVLNLRVAGVDLLQSERGPLVLEVNSSPGLEGIEGSTQRDIASAIIRYLERGAAKFYAKSKTVS